MKPRLATQLFSTALKLHLHLSKQGFHFFAGSAVRSSSASHFYLSLSPLRRVFHAAESVSQEGVKSRF